MRNRVAAPVVIGGSLVVLVATATVAVAWLLWARADDRAHDQDDRAAQTVNEVLQNSIGTVLASLRAAAGLVNARGEVDRASFRSYAQAVGSIGATDGFALAEIVPAADRARFEAATGRRITEAAGPGALRAARQRSSYVPIVAVWPEGDRAALLGFDLTSSERRREAIERARAARRTTITDEIPFALGQSGFQAFRPIYPPGAVRGAPVGYVTTWFSKQVLADVFSTLPPEVRARISLGDAQVYATGDPPVHGAGRAFTLGGRRWVVRASGKPASRSAALTVLVGGGLLALMLGTFTWVRISSERRLVRAHGAERAARVRSELLERVAVHLGAAGTAPEVAAATVADLATAGLDVAAVYAGSVAERERLAAEGSPEALVLADAAAAEAMAGGRAVELATGEEISRYGGARAARLEALLAVPLFGARREAAGALVAGSRSPDRLLPEMRPVVVGVAEQCSVALERARLRSVEEEARRRSDILQRLVASLSGAALPAEVAEASVPYLFEAFDADLATVEVAAGDEVRALNVPAGLHRDAWWWMPVPRETPTPASDAGQGRHLIELHGRGAIQEAYPSEVEQLLSRITSMVVVPLPRAAGAVGVAFCDDRELTHDERRMLDEIAEELTRSLERAALLEAERDARLQAELLERHAARLAAAVTAEEVAAAAVTELVAFGADAVCVWRLDEESRLDMLAATAGIDATSDRIGLPLLERSGVVPDAMAQRSPVVIDTGVEHDARYPGLADERRRLGAESLVALPLRTSRAETIGAICAAAARPHWISAERRPLILGIAEQTGMALERAQLQAEGERVAADNSFLALLGESLERETTVNGRARRVVEALIEGRATFAAVHLVGEEGVVEELASGGSLPPELADDVRWVERIEHAVSTGSTPAFDASPSLLVLPLRARGHSLGALTLRIAAGADWKPVMTPAVAREIAGRAALALENALLYERERGVSHTLQLGLLGGALPDFDRLVVTPAYRAGTAALEVGGDWYDAFSLPSGSSAFVVGDVVGHGLDAAVAMGQLRGAVRALAQRSAPAELLDRLDAFVENVPSAATATLAFVELDRDAGDFRYACAGHPPPLVISPDGRARYLWDGRSAPLGSVLGDRRGDAMEQLAEGETLVLYTDGLVERRSESIDTGLGRLADVARLSALGAPALADDICDALVDARGQDDDVCVLAIHRVSTVAMFSRSFRAAAAELAALRVHLRGWLEENGVSGDVERGVVLVVSEAAANAVEHAYDCDGAGIVTVLVRLAGERAEISVRDEGTWRAPRRDTERGRGLGIMRALADDLSIEREREATVIRMSLTIREAARA